MQVPDNSAPQWSTLIEGKMQCEFQFLATQVLVGRLCLQYSFDPSPETRAKCIAELVDFFKKTVTLPSAQADLQTIFGGQLK